MTRKDYQVLAKVFKNNIEANEALWKEKVVSDYEYTEVVYRLDSIIRDLAIVLKIDNPRFDRDKFIESCGI